MSSTNDASAAEIAHRETVRQVVDARRRVNDQLYVAATSQPESRGARVELPSAILNYLRTVRPIASAAPTNGQSPSRWVSHLGNITVHENAAAQVPTVTQAQFEKMEKYSPFVQMRAYKPPNSTCRWWEEDDEPLNIELAVMGLNALEYFRDWKYVVEESINSVRGHRDEPDDRQVPMPFHIAATAANKLDDEVMDLGLGVEIEPGDLTETDNL